MTSLEQYNKIFCEVFSVSEDMLNGDFTNSSIDGWDSVRQLSLTSALEDAFDLMFDAEDILDMTSYEKGKEIMKKYNIEL